MSMSIFWNSFLEKKCLEDKLHYCELYTMCIYSIVFYNTQTWRNYTYIYDMTISLRLCYIYYFRQNM